MAIGNIVITTITTSPPPPHEVVRGFYFLIFNDARDSIASLKWASGEIGKHVRFRSVCRKAWEFKSPPAHKERSDAVCGGRIRLCMQTGART